MLRAISGNAIGNEFAPFKLLGITNPKTQQIARVFFASLSFGFGCYVISVGTHLATFMAIPFFVAAGYIMWTFFSKRNYENPTLLQFFREKAKNQTLNEIIKEHGWENMMTYGIPPAGEFSEKCREALQTMNLKEIIEFYKIAKKEVLKYSAYQFQLPEPKEFIEKAKNELSELSLQEIYKNYDINELFFFGLVTQEFKINFEQFLEIEKNVENHKQIVDEKFNKKMKKALTEFSEIIFQINEPTLIEISTQLKREISYLNHISPGKWKDRKLSLFSPFSTEFPSSNEWKKLTSEQETFLQKTDEAVSMREEHVRILNKGFQGNVNRITSSIKTELLTKA